MGWNLFIFCLLIFMWYSWYITFEFSFFAQGRGWADVIRLDVGLGDYSLLYSNSPLKMDPPKE